ncbi:Tc5 transposase DNA-binding domain [Popillia japonica]|uniref:Tc5 transposase DNA-binding domain n=1 Tax=Popillia japonica TaxID=7064 RepID=A0AAW1IU79_POPJA
MKSADNQELDLAMYTWFMQIRSQGQPINGPIICEKVLQINRMMNGDPNFKATHVWLQRLKSRHGIRELDIQGKRLSADVASAHNFKRTSNEFCKACGFEPNRTKQVSTGKSCQPSPLFPKGKLQFLGTKPHVKKH